MDSSSDDLILDFSTLLEIEETMEVSLSSAEPETETVNSSANTPNSQPVLAYGGTAAPSNQLEPTRDSDTPSCLESQEPTSDRSTELEQYLDSQEPTGDWSAALEPYLETQEPTGDWSAALEPYLDTMWFSQESRDAVTVESMEPHLNCDPAAEADLSLCQLVPTSLSPDSEPHLSCDPAAEADLSLCQLVPTSLSPDSEPHLSCDPAAEADLSLCQLVPTPLSPDSEPDTHWDPLDDDSWEAVLQLHPLLETCVDTATSQQTRLQPDGLEHTASTGKRGWSEVEAEDLDDYPDSFVDQKTSTIVPELQQLHKRRRFDGSDQPQADVSRSQTPESAPLTSPVSTDTPHHESPQHAQSQSSPDSPAGSSSHASSSDQSSSDSASTSSGDLAPEYSLEPPRESPEDPLAVLSAAWDRLNQDSFYKLPLIRQMLHSHLYHTVWEYLE